MEDSHLQIDETAKTTKSRKLATASRDKSLKLRLSVGDGGQPEHSSTTTPLMDHVTYPQIGNSNTQPPLALVGA